MIVFAAVHESGRWYEVDPCATRETLKKYREGEAARRAQAEKAKARHQGTIALRTPGADTGTKIPDGEGKV